MRCASSTITMMFVAVVQLAARLAELVDGGDEHLAHVLRRAASAAPAAVGTPTMFGTSAALNVAVICVSRSMRSTTMSTVGLPELGVQPQLLRGEDHEQRLAAALEMPDQALLRIALHHALDDLVGGVVLLVAADDLDLAVLLVGGEQVKFCRMSSTTSGRSMLATAALTSLQLAVRLVLVVAPGRPQLDAACGSSRSGSSLPSVAKEKTFGTNIAGTLLLVVSLIWNAPSNHVTALRVGVFASPMTSGRPLTQQRPRRSASRRPRLERPLVGDDERRCCSASSESTSRTGTCSPFGPNGIVCSPAQPGH